MTYFSPNIIKVIISRSIRGTGFMTPMGRRDMHKEFWWANQKKRSHLKVLNVKAIMISKRSSRNRMRGLGLDWSG